VLGLLKGVLPSARTALIEWLNAPTMPAMPSREADAKRLAEIRETARMSPDKFDADPWLAEEQHAIIERMSSPSAGSSPASSAVDGASGTGLGPMAGAGTGAAAAPSEN